MSFVRPCLKKPLQQHAEGWFNVDPCYPNTCPSLHSSVSGVSAAPPFSGLLFWHVRICVNLSNFAFPDVNRKVMLCFTVAGISHRTHTCLYVRERTGSLCSRETKEKISSKALLFCWSLNPCVSCRCTGCKKEMKVIWPAQPHRGIPNLGSPVILT